MKKIDTTTLLSVGSIVLAVASTIVSTKSNNKLMEKTIKEEVDKALKNIDALNK